MRTPTYYWSRCSRFRANLWNAVRRGPCFLLSSHFTPLAMVSGSGGGAVAARLCWPGLLRTWDCWALPISRMSLVCCSAKNRWLLPYGSDWLPLRLVIYIFTAITFAGMIVVHGVIQPLFVAFITATVTIILLCICPLPVWLTNLLCYFGEHSTNIWLVHMFFYGSLFHGIVFFLKYPIPVFLFLIALSLASSYVIKWLSRPILKLVR